MARSQTRRTNALPTTRRSQCVDRLHGINRGEAKIPLTIWHLVGKGTIEEKRVDLLTRKAAVVDAVLDGKEGVSNLNIMDLLTEALLGGGK